MMMMLPSSPSSPMLVVAVALLLIITYPSTTTHNNDLFGTIRMVDGFVFPTITTTTRRPAFIIARYQQEQQQRYPIIHATRLYSQSTNNTRSSTSSSETVISAATTTQQPTIFNGKRIVPYKIAMSALKRLASTTAKVPAVYAILNSTYSATKNTNDGWDTIEYIGITQDFYLAITKLYETFGSSKVAYIRAVTFQQPQPLEMQELIQQWKQQTVVPSNLQENDFEWSNLVVDALSYVYDIDDEDDEDDEDFDEADAASILEDMAIASQAMASYSTLKTNGESNEEATVISPFQQDEETLNTVVTSDGAEDDTLEFTKDNVDAILNEVRPYLIADGGNVAVVNVDTTTNNVYLQLQGACGSCPSSTVTMKMGIERVLREKYPNLNEVIQVTDEPTADSDVDTKYTAVQNELNRLRPAITGMGCTMELVSIDNDTGIITMKFNGSKKVRQGLELALLDLVFINEIQFIE